MPRRLAPLLLSLSLLTIVLVTPARAGGFCRGPIVDRERNRVDMKDFCFFPNVVRVDKGETVKFENYDVEQHTVTAPGNWGGEHHEFFRGDTASFEFEEEGVFPYVCLLHPGMVGVVVVGDGEGPPSVGSAINEVTTPPSGSKDAASEAGDVADPATSPASSTEDNGMSPIWMATLAAGAAFVLYLLVAWARRRFADRGPEPVT